MKLSGWVRPVQTLYRARSQGITDKRAYRWFIAKQGRLPVPVRQAWRPKDGNLSIEAKQMPTGTILVFPPDEGKIGSVAPCALRPGVKQRPER